MAFEESPGTFEAVLTQIFFIPKMGGGETQTIGLLARFRRLWSKLWRPCCAAWEREQSEDFFRGGSLLKSRDWAAAPTI